VRENNPIFKYENSEYSSLDIFKALRDSGIELGDTIFIHSSLSSFGKLVKGVTREEFTNSFLTAVKKSVGSDGTIIMPTFTYSFCKKQVYNPAITPSAVGLFTEAFRKMPNVKRSIDPIFSVSSWGKFSEYYTKVGNSCFGNESVYQKIFDNDVKIVFLGETFDITYIHFVEQAFGVPYRFIKSFKGEIIIDNKRRPYVFDYFVRYLNKNIEYDIEKLSKDLDRIGIITTSYLGFSKIRSLKARKIFDKVIQALKKDIYYLLKQIPDL